MKWRLPNSFPDLSSAKGLSIDIETKDPDLASMGPGVRRDDSYICGVAIATWDKEFSEYYPVAHDEGPNLNKAAVFDWLKGELGRKNQFKVGANLLYDFDYLEAEGIKIGGNRWFDVQIAEPLINENAFSYSLDTLGEKYLDRKKAVTTLEQECNRRGYKGKPQGHIYKMHAKFTGDYAIEDVFMPIDIIQKQKKHLVDENLWDLFIMETELMPMLLNMKQNGVRVDTRKIKTVRTELTQRLKQNQAELNDYGGCVINYNAPTSLGPMFDKLGITYNMTPKSGKPSFTKEFLASHPHPVTDLVLECRKIDKTINTFIDGAFNRYMVAGRIHASFNQLRSDDKGTVTGRFSSTNPNLQQIPKRDDEIGPLMRSMFLPEPGYWWCSADYAAVEYRLLAHYAMGPGAEAVRRDVWENPKWDMHSWTAAAAGIERGDAKTLNFGIVYGQGAAATGIKLGLNPAETKEFLEGYHDKVPFARRTMRAASDRAQAVGYVRTILNRRRRFNMWESADFGLSRESGVFKTQNEAQEAVRDAIENGFDARGGIKRAGAYKSLNAILQGSSADITKKSMVDIWNAGLCEIITMHSTVHDELNWSAPKTKEGIEASKEAVYIMENCVKLKVPLRVDAEVGRSWGEMEMKLNEAG